jgi:UDP-N-acetylglucosamine/UDP-N-acetylgalactosamine 4-epimerase
MIQINKIYNELKNNQYTWFVTGVAGFIGSNLLEKLLQLNQKVIGVDNLSTGYQKNIDEVLQGLSPECHKNFRFYEMDICDLDACEKVMRGADYVLHHAALCSVPYSIIEPLATHATNVTGFFNILNVAKNQHVRRFVYASSSSVYGDSLTLPKLETHIGNPLSPYAASKMANEIYAKAFSICYGIETIGLRYFNVFGSRQDPNGAYAAVIPLWMKAVLNDETVYINGDGETTRDFCYIENVVQANILAALTDKKDAVNEVYNIAVGEKTSLNNLFDSICAVLNKNAKAKFREFREGDIRHSLADIGRARQKLEYAPEYGVAAGLKEVAAWYCNFFTNKSTK